MLATHPTAAIVELAPVDGVDPWARWRAPRQPLVLRGATHGCEELTIAGLRHRAPGALVRAVALTDGALDIGPGRGLRWLQLPLADALDSWSSPQGRVHVATPLRSLPPPRSGWPLPPPALRSRWRRSRLWIGAAGTRSPTHQDANLNAFAQLEGRKRFWLWPPEARAMLGGWPRWTRQCNFAAADPAQERWRDAAAAALVVDLEPGDVLCIPAMWWHHVEALSDGVGLNTWWSSGTALPRALMWDAAFALAYRVGRR